MLKNLIVATVVASLPIAASAVTISGQADVGGVVDLSTSNFNAGGNADVSGPHFIGLATGDFAPLFGTFASVFNDLNFAAAPETIWEAGDFTFVAETYGDFMDTAMLVGFTAYGYFTGVGFDDTDGMLSFSAQPTMGLQNVTFSTTATPVPVPAGILLLGTALAGFGMVGRKRA